jgi:serine/threonine protein kinase
MGVYKLCDFGWSVVENGRRLTYCGTFDYAPPEILKGEQYNYSIDLWEVGIVSYEILFGCLPFFHPSKR